MVVVVLIAVVVVEILLGYIVQRYVCLVCSSLTFYCLLLFLFLFYARLRSVSFLFAPCSYPDKLTCRHFITRTAMTPRSSSPAGPIKQTIGWRPQCSGGCI